MPCMPVVSQAGNQVTWNHFFFVRSPLRPERAFQRDSNQLAARPDPRLLKQLLQGRLDRPIRNAELRADFLVGQALEDASQYLLLAFRQQRADSLLLPLIHPVRHELNHFRIDPNLSTHDRSEEHTSELQSL